MSPPASHGHLSAGGAAYGLLLFIKTLTIDGGDGDDFSSKKTMLKEDFFSKSPSLTKVFFYHRTR
mgnify:CR=1 FL=1